MHQVEGVVGVGSGVTYHIEDIEVVPVQEGPVIYDPLDIDICMNEVGVVFVRQETPPDISMTWVELNELRRIGAFRRPEW